MTSSFYSEHIQEGKYVLKNLNNPTVNRSTGADQLIKTGRVVTTMPLLLEEALGIPDYFIRYNCVGHKGAGCAHNGAKRQPATEIRTHTSRVTTR